MSVAHVNSHADIEIFENIQNTWFHRARYTSAHGHWEILLGGHTYDICDATKSIHKDTSEYPRRARAPKSRGRAPLPDSEM